MALPHDHHLHYRCTFELVLSQPGDQAWGGIVRQIRSWISERIPDEQMNEGFGGKWFFVGGEWQAPRTPRLFVKTERCVGLGNELLPQYWSLRYEHPCAEAQFRQWRTDIGLAIKDATHLLFLLSTIYWLLPGYIGPEPKNPVPTAPWIVTRLLNMKSWEARAGSVKLETVPFLLRDGNADFLLRHLEDVARACPLVLIAKDFASGKPLVDPTKLARLLAGAAIVWESESSWVDKELERLLDPGFSCWNGMVRIYQPGFNPHSQADARRHRYFTKREIETLGALTIEEMLVRGIVRRSRTLPFSGVNTLEEVVAKQTEARLAELKAAARGSQEWTELQEHEITRITNQAKEKDEEIAFLREFAEENDELRDDVQRLKYELNQAVTRAQEAESVRSALAAQASLIHNLERLPTSVAEVLEFASKAFPDRIVFTEKAQKSARQSTLRNHNIAWECIRAMATVLYDFHFTQKLPFGQIIQLFRDSTGFELAVGESETTKKNRKLAALRQDVYKGETIDIGSHVKHGNAPSNSLRVHYFAHPRLRLLIIGHCGDHLDTVRTN